MKRRGEKSRFCLTFKQRDKTHTFIEKYKHSYPQSHQDGNLCCLSSPADKWLHCSDVTIKLELMKVWWRYNYQAGDVDITTTTTIMSASPTMELVSSRIYCNAVWGLWPVIDTLLSLPTIDISSHELLHKFHLSEGDPVPILSMSCPGHENIPGRLLLLHHLLPLARDAANFYPGLTDFLFCNWFSQ